MPSPVGELWSRLAPGSDHRAAAEALLEWPVEEVTALAVVAVAASAEAARVLDGLPRLARRLAVGTVDVGERTRGELRGPVQWSETMSARSASAGDEGLFVCMLPQRSFDNAENRVLVYGLARVAAAERVAAGLTGVLAETAAARAAEASTWLRQRDLATVPRRRRPDARTVRRVRASTRRHDYRPALDLLARIDAPFDADILDGVADDATLRRAEHLLAKLPPGPVVLGASQRPCGGETRRERQ